MRPELPPYVYAGRSAFEWKPYAGPGVRRPTVRLCSLECSVSEVWRAWEARQERRAQTLGWLLELYTESAEFRALAAATRREQARQAGALRRYPLRRGGTFGEVLLARITPGVCRRYLDQRALEGAPVAGNRELALVSAAWGWARERDLVTTQNPVREVRRNAETPARRYVTDDEYTAVLELAVDAPPYLAPAMELAFLCRMRQSEVLHTMRGDVTGDGVDTRRVKGSDDAITTWTPRLRAAVKAARDLPLAADADTLYLLHDRRGRPISKWAFVSAWARLMKRAAKAGVAPFRFHDLKAKGVSDFRGDKRAASGHRTEAMVRVYDRSKKRVKATR